MKEGTSDHGYSFVEKHTRFHTGVAIDWEDVGLAFAAQVFYSGEVLDASVINSALDFCDKHRDEIRGLAH